MIVECESCRTRFRLDDRRVRPEGVRVRCSRCHHKFLVRPATPAEEAAAETGGGLENTAPERRDEEPDLENPQFLLDTPPPAQAGRVAPPEMEGEEPDEEFLDDSPLTPEQEQSLFAPEEEGESPFEPQPEPDEGPPLEQDHADPSSPSAEMEMETGAESLELDFGESGELDLGSSRSEPPAPEPLAPEPPAPEPPTPELESAIGEPEPELSLQGLGDLDEPPSPGRSPDPHPTGPSVRSNLQLEGEPSPGDRSSQPEPRRPAEPLSSAPVVGGPSLLLGLVALLIGLGVAGGAVRSLALSGMTGTTMPAVVRGDGWEARDLETFFVRDPEVGRVLVVRGRLAPVDRVAGRSPTVLGTLVSQDGLPLGEMVPAELRRLDSASLRPDRLARLLAAPVGARTRVSGAIRGFTLLFPDPPSEAGRVSLELRPGPS